MRLVVFIDPCFVTGCATSRYVSAFMYDNQKNDLQYFTQTVKCERVKSKRNSGAAAPVVKRDLGLWFCWPLPVSRHENKLTWSVSTVCLSLES